MTYHVFLADFGLGKVLGCIERGRTTMVAGTPAFQPPEQLKNESCGVSSDTYALACIIVEIFGGRPVWEGLPSHTIILKVAGGTYPSVSHLSPEIAAIAEMGFVQMNQRASAVSILKELCKLLL